MFCVEGSLEEFNTYEEAEIELLEIMEVEDILEFMDCNCEEILLRFLRRRNITEFEERLFEKVNESIERMKDDFITEHEDEEDE